MAASTPTTVGTTVKTITTIYRDSEQNQRMRYVTTITQETASPNAFSLESSTYMDSLDGQTSTTMASEMAQSAANHWAAVKEAIDDMAS